MKTLSTPEVAKLVGIHPITLEKWLAAGKIAPGPRRLQVGRMSVRLWTMTDVATVKRYKARFYCKGRGRKKSKAGRGK